MSDSGQWAASFADDSSIVYEQTLVPTVFTPWAHDLLDTVSLRAGEAVLDVACGSGSLLVVAAERSGPTGRVTGLDQSQQMLAIAADKPLPRGASPVELLTGAADEMPLPDRRFDLVTCQQGLQFFPDRPAALREAHRVCRPGGRLGFSVWRPVPECPGIAAIVHGLGEVLGSEAATAYAAGPWGWTDPDEMLTLTRGAGFDDARAGTRTVPVTFADTAAMVATIGASPIGPQVDALPAAGRQELVAIVAHAMEPYRDGDRLRVPMASTVVIARRGVLTVDDLRPAHSDGQHQVQRWWYRRSSGRD